MTAWWGTEKIFKRDIDLEDIQLIGSPWLTVGVPYNSSEVFIKNVYAGACASKLGLKSIDYTYKKYLDDQDITDLSNTLDAKLLKVTSALKKGVHSVLDRLMIIEKPDVACLFAAGAAYVRLQNTFKGAVLCLRTGLHFETLAMARMLLEQLAWIYKVHNYNDNFFDLLPNKCIKDLKKLLPLAGIMYGELSNKLHIHPLDTLDYIDVKNKMNIILTNPKQTIQNARILLELYDMFCIVGEFIYKDFLNEFQYLKLDESGGYVPNEQRISRTFIRELYIELLSASKDMDISE